MPTYEYLCQTCSHRFETWQKMTDEPLTDCPECGSHIRRVLFAAGVVFKGSGFYKTDHSNSPKGSNGSPPPEQKKNESSTESTANSESKASDKSTVPTPSSTESKPSSTPANK